MPTPRLAPKGRNLALALATLVAFVLLVVLVRRDKARAPNAKAAAGSTAPVAPVSASRSPWAVSAPPQVVAIAKSHEPDRSRVGLWMLEDPNLPQVAADSLISWRFPRGSQPLHPDMIDVLQPNRRNDSKMPLHHKDGSVDVGVQVLFSGDRFQLFGDDTIHATFSVFKHDAPIAVNILAVRARAVEPNSHRPLGPETPLAMTETAPHLFSTSFRATGTSLSNHHGFIDLEVLFDVGDGWPGVATLDLFYQEAQQAPARFTGEVREELRDGSLHLWLGVDVIEAGWYAIDANVFDAAGTPTAMLAARLDLPRGHAEVPLTVFGRVVREENAQAPFKLVNLRGARMLVGQDPDRKLMADGPDYQTRAYALADFSDAEYWDAQKEQRIRNLLAAAQGPGPGLLRRTVAQAAGEGWTPRW
jgi:hypothetical protein